MADVFEPESRRISNPRLARVIADDDGGGPAYISGADVWTPFQAFKIADGDPVTVLNAARGDTAYLYGTQAAPIGIDQRLVDAVAQGSIELKYRLAVSAQEGMVGRVILHLDTFSDPAGTTRVQRHVLNYQSNTGIISGEGSSRLVFDSNVVSFRISADLSNVAAQANGTITLQITDVLFIASPEGLPAPRYLAADADLNSITERGIYARLSSTWTGQNNPFGTGSFLLYVNSVEGIGGRNNGHVQQLIYSFKQNQYYFVRETPAGDGSVPGIPETIAADWQDRNNVAALAEADTRENISIIGQEQRPASVTPESHRITFSTEGFGPNQFYQLDYARLPIIQMRWRPDDYGINNERSQLQTFLRTSQLGGRTPEAVHVGTYNAEVRHAVTVTANADTDTTEIVATIPALLTLSETLLYFNLEFTDGTFLYHRTQTGETAPVRLEKSHAQTWLDVPEEATPQEVEGQTVTGKYISPGNLLTMTPETSPRTVAHFSVSRELDLPADGETIQFSRSADGRTLTHTRRISRSEIGDIPNIMGIADNGGSYLVEYNNTDFIIRQPNYLSLSGTAIQSTNITLKVEIWTGTAEAPEVLERLDILTHEQQIIEHHSIEELIHTSLDFAEFEQSRDGSDTIPQTTEPRIDRAHEIRLVIEIEARGRTQFGTQAFNLAHTWIAAGDNEPYVFEHQLKHSLALADSGAAVDITGKADTDLGNVDADLTDTEKAAIRTKIGAGAPGEGGGTTDITGKADTDLGNVDSDLTTNEQATIRTKIGAAAEGDTTPDAAKADTDLGNVDSDLTTNEQAAIRTKIGAQAAGAVTDITGKADTDLGNVDADLTDAEKTAVLAKIGAPGTDLATVDSDLTDAEKLALRTKIGAAAPGEAGSGGGAAADVTTVDMNFTRLPFSATAFVYGTWTPIAPAQTGLVGPYIISLTSAMRGVEQNGDEIPATGFNRTWVQFRVRKTSGATTTTEGFADEYYRPQATGRNNFFPDASFVVDDLEATDSVVIEARAAHSVANTTSNPNRGVARNTDATEGNLSQISFVPQRAGGAAPAEPAANADNPVIPKPPSDGTDYFLGEGSPPATEEVPNPAHIPAWRNFDDLLSQLAVRTLPDPNTLNRGDIRYLTGAGATEETGPGIHRVIANPVTPLNSITITVGTDSENANEHGASIDAAVGGEYGEFTRNPDNALASVTWFSPTAPAFDIDIRDDLVRGPPSPPTVQRNTLTIGTDRANTPSYGFTSPDTGYGQLSPRTVATRNILELTASEKYGGLTLQLILAGAVPASAITSLEIAGTVYLFSQATRIVRGSNTIFRWPGGSEIPLRPTAVLSVVFRIPATQGALPAEVNIQAVSGADFRYALRRDAPGDATVGGVQYRHYDLKSTAEGGPGVPSEDLTGLADGTAIGFRLWRDNTINNPLNVAPRNLWVWDDRPDFTGGFLDVPQFEELPAVGEHQPGSLIYSDDNVYISRPAAPVTYATPNRVIINMAGHSYGIPGSQYRQNHNFNTNAVDDPTSFIGQMTWDAAPSGNGGDLSVYLRDDDAATPLPNVIIMRGQLFGTGPGGQNRLLRTETTQSIQVDGAAVTYRLYHAATTTWADDHFFNGLAQRTLTFYTAYISETSNTPLMAHPTTIILPSAWDRVSGDRIGPNVLAAVLDFGDNSTTAVNYATGMSIMGAHSVLMKFSMPGNAQLVQITARAWREVRETYVANRAYAGYLGSASRQDYLVTIADTSIIPLRIGRGTGPQLEELRGIF